MPGDIIWNNSAGVGWCPSVISILGLPRTIERAPLGSSRNIRWQWFHIPWTLGRGFLLAAAMFGFRGFPKDGADDAWCGFMMVNDGESHSMMFGVSDAQTWWKSRPILGNYAFKKGLQHCNCLNWTIFKRNLPVSTSWVWIDLGKPANNNRSPSQSSPNTQQKLHQRVPPWSLPFDH